MNFNMKEKEGKSRQLKQLQNNQVSGVQNLSPKNSGKLRQEDHKSEPSMCNSATP